MVYWRYACGGGIPLTSNLRSYLRRRRRSDAPIKNTDEESDDDGSTITINFNGSELDLQDRMQFNDGGCGAMNSGIQRGMLNNQPIVIKLASHDNVKELHHLKHEESLYRKFLHGARHVPACFGLLSNGVNRSLADVLKNDGLVLQYAGATLHQVGRAQQDRGMAGGLPPDSVLLAARLVLEAVKELHERGVLHRDLKPANIALDTTHAESALRSGSEGAAKRAILLDFGIARSIASRDDAPIQSNSGTPDFASVAACLKEAQGPRDDLESLFFTLLSLALPDVSECYSVGRKMIERALNREPIEYSPSTLMLESFQEHLDFFLDDRVELREMRNESCEYLDRMWQVTIADAIAGRKLLCEGNGPHKCRTTRFRLMGLLKQWMLPALKAKCREIGLAPLAAFHDELATLKWYEAPDYAKLFSCIT